MSAPASCPADLPLRPAVTAQARSAEGPEQHVAAFRRSSPIGPDDKLRIGILARGGRRFVQMRVWARGLWTGRLYPTNRGFRIPPGQAEAVAVALAEAGRIAREEESAGGLTAASAHPRPAVR